MKNITDDLSLSTGGFLEFIVLKMLSSRTYSVGELSKALKMMGIKPPMGTLYPLLKRFRENAFVVNGYEESETGKRMKTYDLTENGRRHLTALRGDWKRLNTLVADLGGR